MWPVERPSQDAASQCVKITCNERTPAGDPAANLECAMLNTLQSLFPQGAERAFAYIGGVVGSLASFAFGDVGPLLTWLVIFCVADFLLGSAVAIYRHEWSSHRNFMGILKKALMFLIVALSHGLDMMFEPLIHFQIFESITICAYAAGEFGSLIGNLEYGGFGGVVPPVLRRVIHTLNERLEEKADAALESRGLSNKKESNDGI